MIVRYARAANTAPILKRMSVAIGSAMEVCWDKEDWSWIGDQFRGTTMKKLSQAKA